MKEHYGNLNLTHSYVMPSYRIKHMLNGIYKRNTKPHKLKEHKPIDVSKLPKHLGEIVGGELDYVPYDMNRCEYELDWID